MLDLAKRQVLNGSTNELWLFKHDSDLCEQAPRLAWRWQRLLNGDSNIETSFVHAAVAAPVVPVIDWVLVGFLKQHLCAEFPEINWPADWGKADRPDITPKSLETLEFVGRRGYFDNSVCDICKEKRQIPTYFQIPTSEIVNDLLRTKKLKHSSHDKKESFETWEKNFNRIARKFPHLPLTTKPIEDHLLTFIGTTGRSRRNEFDYLRQLYKHARRRFNLVSDPMDENLIDRPEVDELPPNPLSEDETTALFETPITTREMAALHLLLAHGWRPRAVINILAKDVRSSVGWVITVRGKERIEPAPILPETLELLNNLSSNLEDEEQIFRAKRQRAGVYPPLGEDGLRDLTHELFGRAKITGHVPYDLRSTFAQIAIDHGCDDRDVERLLCHIIPGEGKKYFSYPQPKLVSLLQKYSPLRILKKPISITAGSEECLPSLSGIERVNLAGKEEFNPPPSPPDN